MRRIPRLLIAAAAPLLLAGCFNPFAPNILTERVTSTAPTPTTPQKAAGRMTEPMVCVPKASGQKPAATAAAEPLLLPPGV